MGGLHPQLPWTLCKEHRAGKSIFLAKGGGSLSVHGRHGWAPLGFTLISLTCMGPSGPVATQCPCVPCSGVSRQHSRLSRDPVGSVGACRAHCSPACKQRAQAALRSSAASIGDARNTPAARGSSAPRSAALGSVLALRCRLWADLTYFFIIIFLLLPLLAAGTAPGRRFHQAEAPLSWRLYLLTDRRRGTHTGRQNGNQNATSSERKTHGKGNPWKAPQDPHCLSWTPRGGCKGWDPPAALKPKGRGRRLGPRASFGSAAPQQLMGVSGGDGGS